MMTSIAQLVIPRLSWAPGRGFEASRDTLERGLALGVGGFVLGAAPQEDVRTLTKELRARAKHTLLIAADMERGAGQLFGGATGLPPLAAIASLGEPETLRKAARLTGREARTLGVNWALAPVLDLDLVADNPVVGSRSLGSDPELVAKMGVAWIEACQQEGVLACAKHFPGHGRTTTDSHSERPVVRASRRELMELDLVPFRAAIKAGVASIMTAHVAYPALDAGGAPATLSLAMIRVLLRERLRFEGLVLTDALNMRGVTGTDASEGQAAVGALVAGCDLLMMPTDLDEVVHALAEAVEDGTLDEELVLRSQRRRQKWAQWAAPPNDWRKASSYDVVAAGELAERVVRRVGGVPVRLGRAVDLCVIDDDPGSESMPRETLATALRAGGVDVRIAAAADPMLPDADRPVVIALFGDLTPGKGRVTYAGQTLGRVDQVIAEARRAGRAHLVLQFGHPRLAAGIQCDAVASAWCGDRAMQEAAAKWIAHGGAASRGSVTVLPTEAGA